MFFSAASFAGPLIAGVFATLLQWRWAFVVAGSLTAAIGFSCFFVLSVPEKRGQIAYKTIKGGGFKEIFSVFHIENFVFYLVVACLVEITGMALSFWIPTLLNEYAGYTEEQASALYTLISFCRALVPFTTLWVLHRLFGGRTRLVGILLGRGLDIDEAKAQLSGVTLESLVVAQRVARALRVKIGKSLAKKEDFPLLMHIDEILTKKAAVRIPWEDFTV